jgi:hypothetical protein
LNTQATFLKRSLSFSSDKAEIQGFKNNSIFYAIRQRLQTLMCLVTGGYPLPSLSWWCFSGTEKDLSTRRQVKKRWTWTASKNGTCKCTFSQMRVASDVILNVRILCT